MNKTCSKCGISKPLDEFHKHKYKKDGKRSDCKECNRKKSKIYRQEHREEILEERKKYREEHKEEIREEKKKYYENGGREQRKEYYEKIGREKIGCQSMYKNKDCSAYLGVVIAERLCRHLFKNVEVMPNNNTGYDIICNKGKKIDVKSGCITLSNNKYPYWKFHIGYNKIADFFILVAFDNLTDLNPLHLWMIPGKEINEKGSKSIRPSTIHKWDKWKRDIKDAQLCCNEMKELNHEIQR